MNSEFIQIGRNTIFAGKKRLVASKDSKIQIGNYCAIANDCNIITLNHDYNFPAIQGTLYKNIFNNSHPGEIKNPPNKVRTKGDVIIGNDVWIGEDVLILSGVTIGDGCCIGAKSVVTKDLPAYSICVGSPCKPVKKRYNQDIIKFLLDIKWWNWDSSKIKRNKKFFYTNLNKTKDINNIIVD
jgi:acetyltransferase-like isoleucine patch superfamily enzyme